MKEKDKPMMIALLTMEVVVDLLFAITEKDILFAACAACRAVGSLLLLFLILSEEGCFDTKQDKTNQTKYSNHTS